MNGDAGRGAGEGIRHRLGAFERCESFLGDRLADDAVTAGKSGVGIEDVHVIDIAAGAVDKEGDVVFTERLFHFLREIIDVVAADAGVVHDGGVVGKIDDGADLPP